jgi:hypothetical protein
VKAAAQTFRQNPKLKIEGVLTELAVGEALVSMLDENGSPQIVERAKIIPPRSQVGAITPDQREQIISSSGLADRYKAGERQSAYEKLQPTAQVKIAIAPASAAGSPLPEQAPEQAKPSRLAEALGTAKAAFEPRIGPRGGHYESVATTAIKSVARFAQSQAGQQLIRGLFRNLIRAPSGSKADKSQDPKLQ